MYFENMLSIQLGCQTRWSAQECGVKSNCISLFNQEVNSFGFFSGGGS